MIVITEKQKEIIRKLNHGVYTVEFLEDFINRTDSVFINAPCALNSMGAHGFYSAVVQMEKMGGNLNG